MARRLDGKDVHILNIIQSDAKTAHATIGKKIGLAPSAVFERVRKMERAGVIRSYETRVSPEAVGLGLTAFVFVRADEPVGDLRVGRALTEIPGVQEVHQVAGEDCYLVKLRVADPAALGRILREDFAGIRSIRSTRSTIVLTTVKESALIPVEGACV